ncbi:unnamed protein product [Brachionus calyciflorus]|uniref:Uncharacterized protein n=1 Tax=Brachionus calyciflorus TaxID=104777 RepID=A0A814AG49_9BILA|nr:unnamed protein product [Brachionus calyciflorus]
MNFFFFISIFELFPFGGLEIFNAEKNFDFNIQNTENYIISTTPYQLRTQCFSKCKQNKKCIFVTIQNSSCSLFSKLAPLNKVSSPNNVIYKKKQYFENIVYYWPIDNSYLTEIISGANFISKINCQLTTNRFNTPNSAVILTDGSLQLPSRVYFQGDFTFMIWAKQTELIYESVLFNCTVDNNERVLISFLGGADRAYYAIINNGNPVFFGLVTRLSVDVWYHFTISLKGNTASIYLNGNLEKQGWSYVPASVSRSACYIGGLNTRATVDDIKMFNKALTNEEIDSEYRDQ